MNVNDQMKILTRSRREWGQRMQEEVSMGPAGTEGTGQFPPCPAFSLITRGHKSFSI